MGRNASFAVDSGHIGDWEENGKQKARVISGSIVGEDNIQ